MNSYKKFLTGIVFAVCLLVAQSAFASGQKLVNGAGTLPALKFGVSLDGGIEIPEPLGYGLRFDFGITDRIQLGVGGTFLGDEKRLVHYQILPGYTKILR